MRIKFVLVIVARLFSTNIGKYMIYAIYDFFFKQDSNLNSIINLPRISNLFRQVCKNGSEADNNDIQQHRFIATTI